MSIEADLQESLGYAPLQRMRHSAAHIMAEALQEMFPGAKFALGRAVEDGFYYDCDVPRPLTPADFPEIEQRMAHIVAGRYAFVRAIWSRQQALRYFRDRGQDYKVEIIEQLPQAAIVNALEQLNFPYTKEEGEAGFYGSKLDLVFRDALGHEWQLGTVQVDYNLPERFDLWFIADDGQRRRPVMIHRAPGSIERLVALLIEHYAGSLPVWLAPVQVRVIPIADRHQEYAGKVLDALKGAGVRAEVDKHGERMNAKIRNAQLQKIPYMLVVGDAEAANEAVSVRLRTNENLGAMPLADFIERIRGIIASKSKEL